ncbi:TlpA family protein disulfide reductase [Salinadaptatus halalkaliphilus]|uniref:TlpA family protein disulfide reductase n=1 Tax=Salinadaptatus halalkaliphilus TaxID=2419781 RepID=A0A4V3VLQ4_9EURY|nr:TlpA disulfide reductase family protein [Salinadaptatus halalkaliphilus]THE66537.1 TlpA family protein disulfide reductase [Salinadaptatus halalkaliphilus]
MRRRDCLAGVAAVGASGIGAAYALGGIDRFGDDGIDSFELETLAAPGSEAGMATVPEPGRVTFLELFATWCDVCERSMPAKGDAYETVEDRDCQFVSVSNEPIGNTVTRDDVADWWATHDGRWPLAIDDDLELTAALDATGVPYGFVLDEANVVTWSHRGETAADELREALERQLSK